MNCKLVAAIILLLFHCSVQNQRHHTMQKYKPKSEVNASYFYILITCYDTIELKER